MSEPTNAPMLPPPSGVSGWFSVWRDAVTKPNEQTYATIAQSPNAKLTTALLWVFLGALVNAFLAALVQGPLLNQMLQRYNFDTNRLGGGVGALLIRVICVTPISAVIAVVFFLIIVGIVQVLAKMFGGRGTFDQLAYTFAAIMTPFYLVNAVLTLLLAIPFIGRCFGIVSLLLFLYMVVLEVMAVKGVNQFGWGQAAASVLLPFLALCCCITVGAFAVANLIRTNMQNFPNSFLTPVP